MQRTTTPLFKVINWGKVIHTGSKSSCDVYISKRAIVDISCIVLLVKNIRIEYYDIDFRHERSHDKRETITRVQTRIECGFVFL